MRVDRHRIRELMKDRKISDVKMITLAQIDPIYWANIMTTGNCCEENALTIADILNVPLEDIT